MFIPVTVEVNVGDLCTGFLPVKRLNDKAQMDMIEGEVVKILGDPSIDRRIIMRCKMFDGSIKHFRIAEYRIYQFTFGGVLIFNPKFDAVRIEKKDKIKLNLAHIVILP